MIIITIIIMVRTITIILTITVIIVRKERGMSDGGEWEELREIK